MKGFDNILTGHFRDLDWLVIFYRRAFQKVKAAFLNSTIKLFEYDGRIFPRSRKPFKNLNLNPNLYQDHAYFSIRSNFLNSAIAFYFWLTLLLYQKIP